MSKTTLALPFALALVVSALACTPEVISSPVTYKDVQPILAAHCVRCHNETFFLDPRVGKMPALCHLNRFENTGNCGADAAAGECSLGAGAPSCAGLFRAYLDAPDDSGKRMPPPPSDHLNGWEEDVLKRWGAAPAM
jgi:hypothetical protein